MWPHKHIDDLLTIAGVAAAALLAGVIIGRVLADLFVRLAAYF